MQKKICVLAHPRSGTGYTAKLLRHLGFGIRHERYGKDGISDWMFAVTSNDKPWGVKSNKDVAFQYTIHIIREPVKAISSISFTENNSPRSVEFRKKFIDLQSAKNQVDLAVRSYILWNDLIKAKKPSLTLTLENAWFILPAFLIKEGFSIDKRLIKKAPTKKVNQRPHQELSLNQIMKELPLEWKNKLLNFMIYYEKIGHKNIKTYN